MAAAELQHDGYALALPGGFIRRRHGGRELIVASAERRAILSS